MKVQTKLMHVQTARCSGIKGKISDAAGSHNPRNKNPLYALDALNDLAMWHNHVDELMRYYVATARKQGLSWTHIGNALGMNKQSAQQRFGKPSEPAS